MSERKTCPHCGTTLSKGMHGKLESVNGVAYAKCLISAGHDMWRPVISRLNDEAKKNGRPL